MNLEEYDWDRLTGLGFAEKTKEGLKGACWKNYEAIGMKTKNGKKVPNCVKKKKKSDYAEDPRSEMTPNFLPEEEGGAKPDDKNRKLAMASAPNYSEDFSEPNGRMAITQLRAMREKIDIMLGMLYPDDNLPPWCATKITNAGTGLASVADFLRFGDETF